MVNAFCLKEAEGPWRAAEAGIQLRTMKVRYLFTAAEFLSATWVRLRWLFATIGIVRHTARSARVVSGEMDLGRKQKS